MLIFSTISLISKPVPIFGQQSHDNKAENSIDFPMFSAFLHGHLKVRLVFIESDLAEVSHLNIPLNRRIVQL